MYERNYWSREDVEWRISFLRRKLAGTLTKRLEKGYTREIENLKKAREWKCQHCGTTIDELLRDGPDNVPWNLYSKYCPGGGCAADAKAEKQRERRAEKREEATEDAEN